MHVGLGRARSVDHALVEIGGAKAPDPAREHDVVAVVHLGEVVEGARLLGIREPVLTAVVLDVDEPLFDVDVRRAVLAHRPQLDQVGLGGQVLHGEQDVQRAHDVVDLGDHGVPARQHRERRGAVFGVVDDGLGFEAPEDVLDELPLGDVADERLDGALPEGGPRGDAVLQRGDRDERVRPDLVVPQPPVEAVGHRHVVAAAGQMHRGRPPQIAVTAQYEDPHGHPPPSRPHPQRGTAPACPVVRRRISARPC